MEMFEGLDASEAGGSQRLYDKVGQIRVAVEAVEFDQDEPDIKAVKRVPSFMNLEEDFSSLPVFGELQFQAEEEGSPESPHNHNGVDEYEYSPPGPATFSPETSPGSSVVVKTPKSLLHSGVYRMENIPSVQDIEKMSGPLLRGYLKSVGITRKGKRAELMALLVNEFLRYQKDPDLYMRGVPEAATPRKKTPSEPSLLAPRTKKRSLKAREADESVRRQPPDSVKKSLRRSLSPQQQTETPSKKAARALDPNDMPAELRLARYESIARQVVKSAGQPVPLNPSDLMRSFCGAVGYNAHGVPITEGEEKLENPAVDPAVGNRVEVLWVQDATDRPMWYAGTVCRVSGGTRPIHSILYDDGEERSENLQTKQWRFCRRAISFVHNT